MDIFFDFIAVFSDTYYKILRTLFFRILKTAMIALSARRTVFKLK